MLTQTKYQDLVLLLNHLTTNQNGPTDQQRGDQNGPTDQQHADQNDPTDLFSVVCIIAFPHLVGDQNDPTAKPKWHHR